MQYMKDQAIVCNIGHFDNEIQVDRLNEDKTLIVYAAAQAQKAADFILGRTMESEAAA